MIMEALKRLRPTSEFSLDGDLYEGIIWHDTETTQPTEGEVSAEIASMESENMTASLDKALAKKIAEIDSKMKQEVETEFTSSSLGSPHSYDCLQNDHININHELNELRAGIEDGANAATLTVDYWSKAAGSEYTMASHTIAQLKDVHRAMIVHINSRRTVATSLKAAANAGRSLTGSAEDKLAAIEAVDVSVGWPV